MDFKFGVDLHVLRLVGRNHVIHDPEEATTLDLDEFLDWISHDLMDSKLGQTCFVEIVTNRIWAKCYCPIQMFSHKLQESVISCILYNLWAQGTQARFL